MIKFNCPACGKKLAIQDKHAGKKAKCPQCNAVFRLPEVPPREDIPLASASSRPVQKSPPPSVSLGRLVDGDDQQGVHNAPHGPVTERKGNEKHLMPKITSGITASTALLAVILFFLPWLRLSCANTDILSQSGFQIAIAGASTSPQMERLKQQSGEMNGNVAQSNLQADKDQLEADWPLLFLPACLAGLIVVTIVTVAGACPVSVRLCCVGSALSFIGLVILVIYLFAGFALERQMDKAEAQMPSNTTLPDGSDNPWDAVSEQFGTMLLGQVKVERTAVLYLCLVLTLLSCVSALLTLAWSRGWFPSPL